MWKGMPGRARILAVVIVVMLVADVAALFALDEALEPPSFARGGRFRSEAPPVSSTTTSSSSSTTAVGPATPTSTAPPRALSAPPPPGGGGGATPLTPRPAAPGTYTYDVEGTESAGGFGSRSLPSTLRLVAHRGGGVGPDGLVLDVTLSPLHEERKIATYRPDGMFFTYEAGSITFAVVTESSAVAYEPPMGQVPFPLEAGATRAGTSLARERDGRVVRVEDWSVRVVGREVVTAAGGPADTWVVAYERRSRPGAEELVVQSRTYWFDPARGLWVKWRETIDAERRLLGVVLSYDTQYSATLQDFRAA